MGSLWRRHGADCVLSREGVDGQAARKEFEEHGYTLQNSLWRIPKDGQVFLDNLE